MVVPSHSSGTKKATPASTPTNEPAKKKQSTLFGFFQPSASKATPPAIKEASFKKPDDLNPKTTPLKANIVKPKDPDSSTRKLKRVRPLVSLVESGDDDFFSSSSSSEEAESSGSEFTPENEHEDSPEESLSEHSTSESEDFEDQEEYDLSDIESAPARTKSGSNHTMKKGLAAAATLTRKSRGLQSPSISGINLSAFQYQKPCLTPLRTNTSAPHKASNGMSHIQDASLTNDQQSSLPSITAPTFKEETPLKTNIFKNDILQQQPAADVARYDWLVNIRDAQKRAPDHPEYDKSTLYIPNDAWRKFTPFETQYWEIKCVNWDIVVFFKKGKFYELYEKDAILGNKEFDLRLTDRVNMCMAGVPEKTFSIWATKFIALGYKVAQVDESESNLEKSMREKNTPGTKKTSIITRTLSHIYTIGTLLGDMVYTEDSNYLMSIYLYTAPESKPKKLRLNQLEFSAPTAIGVDFIDVSTGSLHHTVLKESEISGPNCPPSTLFSQLETILMQVNPKEVLLDASIPATFVDQCLNTIQLTPQITLVNAKDISTVGQLKEMLTKRFANTSLVPPTLKRLISAMSLDTLEQTSHILNLSSPDAPQLMSFVLLFIYLGKLNITDKVMEILQIFPYSLHDFSSNLILDGQTLMNLEILLNNETKSVKGSLLSLFNHTKTPFGKRLFIQWLSHPLKNIDAINARYDTLNDIFEAKLENFFDFRVPDLERSLAKIQNKSIKPEEFLEVLRSMHKIYQKLEAFSQNQHNFQSQFLQTLFSQLARFPPATVSDPGSQCIQENHAGQSSTSSYVLPILSSDQQSLLLSSQQALFDMRPVLEYFIDIFEFSKKNAGASPAQDPSTCVLLSKPGADLVYDQSLENLQSIEAQLLDHLTDVQNQFGHKTHIRYRDLGSEFYQLEIPTDTKVPNNYILKSQTKAVKRYWTPFILKKQAELAEAKVTLQRAHTAVYKNLLQSFAQYCPIWRSLIQMIATFDCHINLAMTSQKISMDGQFCRPELVASETSVLELNDMVHPCASLSSANQYFVPNTVTLGDKSPNLMVLTGPNMGGKSTLLRQTCLAVILAQLGCFLPATSCRLTPVDRIFTRIGAQDNILANESTFMVELNETSNILRHATKHSLVIFDELGRGTSTFDGYAIAYAVVLQLLDKIKCRSLFSTHYQMLCSELEKEARHVSMQYMSYLTAESGPQIEFLYKLVKGVCPKSFGMNVAHLAGLPAETIALANRIATEFEGKTLKWFQHKREKELLFASIKRAIYEKDFASIKRLKANMANH